MPKLKLLSANIDLQVKSGSELLEIKKRYPELPLKFGCTKGHCGVCAIKIVAGSENLTKKSKDEKTTLEQKKLDADWRLACQCALNGDIEIA